MSGVVINLDPLSAFSQRNIGYSSVRGDGFQTMKRQGGLKLTKFFHLIPAFFEGIKTNPQLLTCTNEKIYAFWFIA
jgi:hypothetical protein